MKLGSGITITELGLMPVGIYIPLGVGSGGEGWKWYRKQDCWQPMLSIFTIFTPK